MVELDVLERVIDLIKDGTGWNPYFAYGNLSNDLKQKCSLCEMIVLFYKLEWNCRIIDTEEVYETKAYDPWIDNPSIKKKAIRYKLREDILLQFVQDPLGPWQKSKIVLSKQVMFSELLD